MGSRHSDRLMMTTVEAPSAADIVGCAGGSVKIGLVDGSFLGSRNVVRRTIGLEALGHCWPIASGPDCRLSDLTDRKRSVAGKASGLPREAREVACSGTRAEGPISASGGPRSAAKGIAPRMGRNARAVRVARSHDRERREPDRLRRRGGFAPIRRRRSSATAVRPRSDRPV